MGNPASFDLNPVAAAITTNAMPIAVVLYEPGSPYTVLPNVYCLRIDYREGPEPPVARFQYMTDDLLQATAGWPSQFEQLWPLDAKGDYVVINDDRLVVMTQIPPATPDGKPQIVVLFDGFAQIPQVDVSAQHQAVTFTAIGAAIRLWDVPIFGRTQRDASDATDTTGGSDYFVELPARFNPSDTSIAAQGGYMGNAVSAACPTQDNSDTSSAGYPVFLDPLCVERSSSSTTFWYVADAMSYLIGTEASPNDPAGNPYVIYPTLGSLQSLLACMSPPSDGLLNAGDAQSSNILIRDYDASNKAVPDVMAELLRYCGFVMVFSTDADSNGNPQTKLKMIRKDCALDPGPQGPVPGRGRGREPEPARKQCDRNPPGPGL